MVGKIILISFRIQSAEEEFNTCLVLTFLPVSCLSVGAGGGHHSNNMQRQPVSSQINMELPTGDDV